MTSQNTDSLISSLSKQCGGKPMSHPCWCVGRWLLLGIIYVETLLILFGMRADIGEKIHSHWYFIELAIAAATGVMAATAASWHSYPDIRQQEWVRWPPVLGLSALVAFKVLEYVLVPDNTGSDMPSAVDCMACLIGFSVIPAVLLFLALRRAAPVHFCWAGSFALLAAGCMSYIGLRMIEANDNVMHIISFHIVPLFGLMAVGVVLGQRALRW